MIVTQDDSMQCDSNSSAHSGIECNMTRQCLERVHQEQLHQPPRKGLWLLWRRLRLLQEHLLGALGNRGHRGNVTRCKRRCMMLSQVRFDNTLVLSVVVQCCFLLWSCDDC
jgi:hypothetical protein